MVFGDAYFLVLIFVLSLRSLSEALKDIGIADFDEALMR